jgi:hypothetical protein
MITISRHFSVVVALLRSRTLFRKALLTSFDSLSILPLQLIFLAFLKLFFLTLYINISSISDDDAKQEVCRLRQKSVGLEEIPDFLMKGCSDNLAPSV